MGTATLQDSVLGGMLWMSWGKAARAVLQIVILAVLARLISPSDFGVVSAAFIFIGFTATFAQIGLGKALVQHPSPRSEHIAVAFYTSLALGILLATITWVFAPLIAGFFRIGALAFVLKVMSVTFLLRSVGVVSESQLQRELRFRWLANRELASYAVGYAGVGIPLAVVGWGVWALVAANLAQAGTNSLLLLIAKPISLTVRPSSWALRELMYFSGGYTLGRIANQLASQGDNLVVGRFLGPSALGVYGRAFQLMAVPADVCGDIIDNVLFPAMARTQNDLQRLASAYRRGISLLPLVVLPASVMFCLLAPQIVDTLLGNKKWHAGIAPFQFLAIGLMFRTGCRISDALTRASGYVYERAWRQGIYATCVIGGALSFLHWGVAGVAFGVVLALGINFFLMAQISLRIVHLSWPTFFGAHVPAVVLAGAAGLAVYLASMLISRWSTSSWIVLIGAALAGSSTAAALLLSRPHFFLGSDGLRTVAMLRARMSLLTAPFLPRIS